MTCTCVPFLILCPFCLVLLCVCGVYLCVCVREREGEKEREIVSTLIVIGLLLYARRGAVTHILFEHHISCVYEVLPPCTAGRNKGSKKLFVQDFTSGRSWNQDPPWAWPRTVALYHISRALCGALPWSQKMGSCFAHGE